MYCDLPCEESSDPNCGGWGFMTVFQIHKSVPASPLPAPWSPTKKGDEITYKGCYDVKENPDIFNKFVKSSKWMTNEVQWRLSNSCGL